MSAGAAPVRKAPLARLSATPPHVGTKGSVVFAWKAKRRVRTSCRLRYRHSYGRRTWTAPRFTRCSSPKRWRGLGVSNIRECTNCTIRYNSWLQEPRMPNGTPGSFDLHLAPGSPALNRGDPGTYPAPDIDGQSRPLGSGPDAGADEAG
jgi:hypothetical protein